MSREWGNMHTSAKVLGHKLRKEREREINHIHHVGKPYSLRIRFPESVSCRFAANFGQLHKTENPAPGKRQLALCGVPDLMEWGSEPVRFPVALVSDLSIRKKKFCKQRSETSATGNRSGLRLAQSAIVSCQSTMARPTTLNMSDSLTFYWQSGCSDPRLYV